MSGFFRGLQQPEYVHTLINPLPVYGLGIGLFALSIAMFLRNGSAHIPALTVIFLAAASAWPVKYYGEQAYDRVLSMSDETGSAWLAAHEDRADKFIWSFYLLAVAAAAAIVVPMKFPKSAMPLIISTILLSIASLAAGGYIAYAGGKIRHREFRTEPPPPKPVERAE
ncbi:MAG: hypothetical protein DMF40_14075 [Verrucomicrobia bacterium]|nr:MAG: hypothetical protein DMF40_14075 [Verrucomicrobiota bacterium]